MAGKPHTHPVTHPDYTPGVFPSVYRKSHDKSDASRFNRHLKRIQQAKLRQWEGERSKEQEDDRQEEQESLQCTVDEDMHGGRLWRLPTNSTNSSVYSILKIFEFRNVIIQMKNS